MLVLAVELLTDFFLRRTSRKLNNIYSAESGPPVNEPRWRDKFMFVTKPTSLDCKRDYQWKLKGEVTVDKTVSGAGELGDASNRSGPRGNLDDRDGHRRQRARC